MTAATTTTTIETVSVVRPLKVIALVCLCLAFLLIVIAVATPSWVKMLHFKAGLFIECTASERQFSDRLPIGAPDAGQCQSVKHRGAIFVQATAALLIISFLVVFFGIILTALGLNVSNFARKYLYYRIALYMSLVAVFFDLISLIVFPVCLYYDLADWGVTSLDFDWSYGLAWAGTLCTFFACLLLICDKEHEEVYYKEKTVYSKQSGRV